MVESWKHCCWECELVKSAEIPAKQVTNKYCKHAMKAFESNEAFWGRGIHTPEHLRIPDPPTAAKAEELEQWAWPLVFASTFGRVAIPSTAYEGSDGSGGQNSRDPRTRRFGCSFVIFD